MKRIHLFEFEDFKWFPNWLRDCMTNYIVTFHRLLGTHQQIAGLLDKCLKHSSEKKIVDLCSGGGGPMLEVKQTIEEEYHHEEVSLTFTDLYPNKKTANRINSLSSKVSYKIESVNAAEVPHNLKGVRSMVCSFHHMNESIAESILRNAQESKQSICIYEISDNSFPKWIWWIAFPINIISVFIITPFVRPFTWQQFVFTYLVPLLPIFIGWDGAVSNARTYTLEDLNILLSKLEPSEAYTWEKGKMKGKGGNKLYLLGLPIE